MAYGDGSIYQRADGRWVASIDTGWTERGTRRRKRLIADTRTEARRRLRDWQRTHSASGSAADPRTTVRQWCTQWLDDYQQHAKPRTWATDASAVRRWIIPTIGQRRLADLTPADLRTLDRAILAAGRSATTAHNVRSLLGRILRAAVVEGHAVPDPVRAARQPASAESDRQAIPPAAAAALLITATSRDTWPPLPPDPTPHTDRGVPLPGRDRTPTQRAAITAHRGLELRRQHALDVDPSRWAVALLQALRQGEALGLTWDRVDLEAGVMDISWQLQELPAASRIPDHHDARHLTGRYWLLRPKSRAGRRMVPLAPMVADALIAWQPACPPSRWGLVWPRADGTPRSRAVDRHAWYGLQEAAGVARPDGDRYVLHEARHTAVSLLLAAGVAPEVVIQVVGHSTFASTRGYAHVDLGQARAALQAAAAILTPALPPRP